jgi:hypothetical protein
LDLVADVAFTGLTARASARASGADAARSSSAVGAGRASAQKIHNEIYDKAKQEFIQTGKINGYELLNLRPLEKLWISHYDFELLT